MRIPLATLHDAIFEKLSNALAPQEVFTFVPKTAQFPLVVIGDFAVSPIRTKSSNESLVIGTILVYTQGPSMKQTEELAGAVVECLSGEPEPDLSGSGFCLSDATLRDITTYRDDDGASPFQRFAISFQWKIEEVT